MLSSRSSSAVATKNPPNYVDPQDEEESKRKSVCLNQLSTYCCRFEQKKNIVIKLAYKSSRQCSLFTESGYYFWPCSRLVPILRALATSIYFLFVLFIRTTSTSHTAAAELTYSIPTPSKNIRRGVTNRKRRTRIALKMLLLPAWLASWLYMSVERKRSQT